MSEPELRRALQVCLERLVVRGRPQLAQRLGTRVEALLGAGEVRQAHALISLFAPPRSPVGP